MKVYTVLQVNHEEKVADAYDLIGVYSTEAKAQAAILALCEGFFEGEDMAKCDVGPVERALDMGIEYVVGRHELEV